MCVRAYITMGFLALRRVFSSVQEELLELVHKHVALLPLTEVDRAA